MEKIWLTLEDRLKAFILSKVKDPSIAMDILQEVYLRMHEKIDSLKDKDRIQSWLYQITRNLIIDYFRKEKRSQELLDLADTNDQEPENLMAETLEDMLHMMDDMPPEYCEALCLTEFKGMSQKEYATHIGISYSGAKSRVQRAKRMLKDMLMNCCHYEFDKYGTVIDIHPVQCCCCQDSSEQ